MRSSMSKMALSRCKILVVATESEEPYARVLSVVDPRRHYQVVAHYRTRTDSDTRRIQQRFMGKYRIPKELVITQPSLELPTEAEIQSRIDSLFPTTGKQNDMPQEDRGEVDADRAKQRSLEVHESR